MANQTGGPAFPIINIDQQGMTLRDYFAAQVLPAIYAEGTAGITNWSIACHAYAMADMMIAARDTVAAPPKPKDD